MDDLQRLQAWMHSQGFSMITLANRMGVSYHAVYQNLVLRKNISGNFKWRFVETFGADIATQVFAIDPEPSVEPAAEPTPEPA